MDDNKTEDNSKWIPDGFVEVLGPTGDKYLVPEFYAPLVALKAKNNLDLENFDGTVRNLTFPFGIIGEGLIMSPMDPESSDRERMSAHAEILELQNKLGISYKDASHRLYMAEMEKLKAEQKTIKAIGKLRATTKAALESAYNAVKEIGNVNSEELESSN